MNLIPFTFIPLAYSVYKGRRDQFYSWLSADADTIELTFDNTIAAMVCDFYIGSINTAAIIKISCSTTKDLVDDGGYCIEDVTVLLIPSRIG